MDEKDFEPGLYQHWKGGLYWAECTAMSAHEPVVPYVVYRSVSDPGRAWVRRLDDFFAVVGPHVGPRFRRVAERVDDDPSRVPLYRRLID